jgi:hypothetical protein
MPSITAESIIERAGKILADSEHVRWERADLLDWLNEGQRKIVVLKPEVNPVVSSVQLVSGTKQSIPADGIALLKVVRNLKGDDLPGKTVSIIDVQSIDALIPDWHSKPANAEVQHYIYDASTPKVFYVYPPQPETETGRVEVVYSLLPAPVSDESEAVISLPDEYDGVILDYVLYRAYSSESDTPAGFSKAQAYYNVVLQSLGLISQVEALNNPNNDMRGGNG